MHTVYICWHIWTIHIYSVYVYIHVYIQFMYKNTFLCLLILPALNLFKGTQARDFLGAFLLFFWHQLILERSLTQDSWNFKSSFLCLHIYLKILITQCFQRKRADYLPAVSGNTQLTWRFLLNYPFSHCLVCLWRKRRVEINLFHRQCRVKLGVVCENKTVRFQQPSSFSELKRNLRVFSRYATLYYEFLLKTLNKTVPFWRKMSYSQNYEYLQ